LLEGKANPAGVCKGERWAGEAGNVSGGEGKQGALTGLDVLQVTMRETRENGSTRQFPERRRVSALR
jgi:hypothetical protein